MSSKKKTLCKLLKLQRFSFENLCENKEQFCGATGINPDCFMRLFNHLNPGYDCSNIKLYDTCKRASVCQRKSTQIQGKLNLVENRKFLQKSNYSCI